MPGTKLFLFGIRTGWRALDTGAQEALEIFGFPSGDVFLVYFGLVFDEEIESGFISIRIVRLC